VNTHRIEIFHSCFSETICYLFSGDNASNWVPIAHGFTHRDDIRNNILQLESPPVLAHSAKAHLDFVSEAYSSGIPHMLIDLLEVVLGRYDLTSTAQKTLSDECTDSFSFFFH